MTFLQQLPKPFFVLAPMDDVTDTVFRQVVADLSAPDLYFTEFVNVDGLQSPGRANLLKKLQFVAKEQPLIAQIWGKIPVNFEKTAAELVDMGFVGIDLNMGCPEKTVVKNGCCSALINNRELAAQIIAATQRGAAGRVPVSVKTRLGFNEVDLSWPEFLLQQNLDMLTIHGRTRKEMSEVPAHWDLIGEVRELRDRLAPQTLIVGNGDVTSRAQGLELAQKYQLDGIMIGRGIFHDPFVFAEASPWADYSEAQRLDLYAQHVKLFAATWQNRERNIHTLNRFCKVYINGFDGASALRAALMLANSTREILELLDNHQKAQPRTSYLTTRAGKSTGEEVKAIIFDADGTLLDTRELIMEGYKTVLGNHGLEHLATEQYIRQRLGKPVPETYEQILAGHNADASVETLAAEHDKVQDATTHLIKPYAHADDFLRRAKAAGIKLCLFTSGKRMMIERNFAAAHLPNPYELFDAVVAADDHLAHKPEPDAILELLRQVEVSPQNAVVVGDHGYDMIAASRAKIGLKIGIAHGFGTPHELQTAGADVLAPDLLALEQLMPVTAES